VSNSKIEKDLHNYLINTVKMNRDPKFVEFMDAEKVAEREMWKRLFGEYDRQRMIELYKTADDDRQMKHKIVAPEKMRTIKLEVVEKMKDLGKPVKIVVTAGSDAGKIKQMKFLNFIMHL
jgi:hypothetical protein